MGFTPEYFKRSLSCISIVALIILLNQSPTALCDPDKAPQWLDTVLQNYDRRFRPNHGKSPLTVNVTAYILSMPEIDSNMMTITLNLYFRQSWVDERLKSPNDHQENILLDGINYDKIWVPDTFFVNELSATHHETTLPNVLVRIEPTGAVMKSARYTVQLSCPMTFKDFPFDTQYCYMEIESYAMTANDMKYQWGKSKQSLGVNSETVMYDFRLEAFKLEDQSISLTSGNYSRLAVAFKFKRISSGRYMLEFYMPSVFLTSLSLVSLFLSDSRLAILINIITMGFTVIFLSISSGMVEIPKVTYSTALDVFAGITHIFIFLSLGVSLAQFYLTRGGKTTERIELSRFGVPSSSGNRPERLQDDEVNLCSNQTNARPVPATTLQSIIKTVEDILTFLLPFIKIAIVVSYIFTIIIYSSVYPNSDSGSELSEEWTKLDFH